MTENTASPSIQRPPTPRPVPPHADRYANPTGPHAEDMRARAERCRPWFNRAALVFVERRVVEAWGQVHRWHYVPAEGVIVGAPFHFFGDDVEFPRCPGESLDAYRATSCPDNYRFLDRVTYSPPAGKNLGGFECHRLPEVAALWEQTKGQGWVSFHFAFDIWPVTPEQAARLEALCERRAFIFGEPAVPKKRRVKPKPAPEVPEPAAVATETPPPTP